MRSVTININQRCPLRCKHCMVGFAGPETNSSWRVSKDELAEMIRGVGSADCRTVLLAGGEPSLEPDLIRHAIETGRELKVKVGIVSAPIWASTRDKARAFLSSIGHLDVLLLSYDRYHLEFLKFANYENAALEAGSRGTSVSFILSYADDADLEALRASLRTLQTRAAIGIGELRVFPHGNARGVDSVRAGAIRIESAADLKRIKRGCMLGDAVIDDAFRVHGCCWSTVAQRSPFTRAGEAADVGDALRAIEGDALFRTVERKGFLDALTERGQAEVVARLKGQYFAQECEVCVKLMTDDAAPVWSQCLGDLEAPGQPRSAVKDA